MFKKLVVILIGIYFATNIVLSQSKENTTEPAYKIGFSTYLSHVDKYFAGFDVYTDDKGYVYFSGNTRDKNFPATEKAFQTNLKGSADAFVAKFDPDGKIVFATLIGGTKREHHTGLTVDEQGYIYLVGGTHSSDFPVTSGSYDTSFNGEKSWGGDVYLVKLNPNGTDIIFSTFIGGSEQETAHKVCIDPKGNIIIGGTAVSPDFPTTEGVIDRDCKGGDGFVAKFSPNADKLLFSTVFGGDKKEGVSGLAVDSECNIYISGCTMSEGLPVTENALRKNLILAKGRGFQNGMDHYLAKIDADGKEILYCTYFAGKGHTSSNLEWANPNKLLISSNTALESFPITDNAIGKQINGDRDGYFSIFNSDDMTLEYSTLLGGSEYDFLRRAFFINENMIVVGGITNSSDFPLTENAIDKYYPLTDKTFNSGFLGRRKAFISVIDIKKRKLVYSTYFGACLRFKIFPNQSGNLSFIAETGSHGFTQSTDFPLTKEAFQTPPTFIMLGQLVLNDILEQKK